MDCALAELYVRGLATERLVKDQHQAEIFNSIYTRMNEVSAGCAHSKRQILATALHVDTFSNAAFTIRCVKKSS